MEPSQVRCDEVKLLIVGKDISRAELEQEKPTCIVRTTTEDRPGLFKRLLRTLFLKL